MCNATLFHHRVRESDPKRPPLSVYVGFTKHGLVNRWLWGQFSHCALAQGAANARDADEMANNIHAHHTNTSAGVFHLYMALSKVRERCQDRDGAENMKPALFVLENREGKTAKDSEKVYIQELKKSMEGEKESDMGMVFNTMD